MSRSAAGSQIVALAACASAALSSCTEQRTFELPEALGARTVVIAFEAEAGLEVWARESDGSPRTLSIDPGIAATVLAYRESLAELQLPTDDAGRVLPVDPGRPWRLLPDAQIVLALDPDSGVLRRVDRAPPPVDSFRIPELDVACIPAGGCLRIDGPPDRCAVPCPVVAPERPMPRAGPELGRLGLPAFLPCPDGWIDAPRKLRALWPPRDREIDTCEPPTSDSAPAACGPTERRLGPAEARRAGRLCEPLGPACPIDTFAADAPPDAIFVDPNTAADPRTGRREAPFRSIAEALANTTAETATIALANTTHGGAIHVDGARDARPRKLKILGACAESTVIDARGLLGPALSARGGAELEVSRARVLASGYAAVANQGALVLEDLRVETPSVAISAEIGGRVAARGLVVRGAALALRVRRGTAKVNGADIGDSAQPAEVTVAGSGLELSDAVITGSAMHASNRSVAIEIEFGASATVSRTLIRTGGGIGIQVQGASSRAHLDDVLVLGPREDDGFLAVGVSAEGGLLTATTIAIRGSTTAALVARGGAVVDLERAFLRPKSVEGSRGITVQGDATLSGRRVAIRGARGSGIFVRGGRASFSDLWVEQTYGTRAEIAAVRTSCAGHTLLERAVLSDNYPVAASSADPGSRLELRSVFVDSSTVVEHDGTDALLVSNATATVDGAEIAGYLHGIRAALGASAVIADVRLGSRVYVHSASSLSLERAEIHRHPPAIVAGDDRSSGPLRLVGSDILLVASSPPAAEGTDTMLKINEGDVTLSRIEIVDSEDGAIHASCYWEPGLPCSRATIQDLVIERSRGMAVKASARASVAVTRASIADFEDVAFHAEDSGFISATDVLTRGSGPRSAAVVSADQGGIVLSRFHLDENGWCGVRITNKTPVEDARESEASAGTISNSETGLCVELPGFDVRRLLKGVRFLMNGTDVSTVR